MSIPLSRSGDTNAGGKLCVHLAVVMSESMHDDLTGVAFAHGMSKSEYARHVLEQHLYGAKASVVRRVAGRMAPGDASKVAPDGDASE